MYSQIAKEAIINVWDASNIYRIPLALQEQGVCNLLNKQLALEWRLPTALQKWHDYAEVRREDGRSQLCHAGCRPCLAYQA